MKKQLLLLFLTICGYSASAQIPGEWKSGLKGTTSYTPGARNPDSTIFIDGVNSINQIRPATGPSWGYLSAPESGYNKITISTSGKGKIEILNTGTANGQLKLNASTTGNATKFSYYERANSSPVTITAFTVLFSDVANTGSTWVCAIGSGASGTNNIFSNASAFGNAKIGDTESTTSGWDAFNIFNWVIAENGSVTFNYRALSANATPTYYPVTNGNALFVRGGTYSMEIYSNNSAIEQKYTRNNVEYSLPPRKTNVWATNISTSQSTLITATDAAIGANLPNFISAVDQDIRNFLIYGISSTTGGTASTNGEMIIGTVKMTFGDYPSSVLPVSLTSFSGKSQGDKVKLAWETSSERNNSHFEILRASKNRIFSPVGKVVGHGNSDEIRTYSFVDESPIVGFNYYKLRQVDFDGKETIYEKAVSIKTSLFKEGSFTVSAIDENNLLASIYANGNTFSSVKITDVSGKVLLSRSIKLNAGENKVHMTTDSFLKSGVYIATLTIDNQSQSIKFIK